MKERNLDEYLKEICMVPLLTEDEECELLKAVQEKGTDCEEMKRLEKAMARFVVSLSGAVPKQGAYHLGIDRRWDRRSS